MAQISATHTPVSQDATARPSDGAANRYWLRASSDADVRTLEEIERGAFPTMTAGTPFRSDVGRSTSHYLLAVRAGDTGGTGRTGPQSGMAAQFIRAARSLASTLMFQGVRPRPVSTSEYVAGFVGLWFVLDECHVISIATRQEERRRGVGELLMIGAIETALQRGSRVLTLEVRASNVAAKSLYRKYGFEEVGLRKRYYTDNDEDAIIMTTRQINTKEYRSHFESLVARHASRWGSPARSQLRTGHAADAR